MTVSLNYLTIVGDSFRVYPPVGMCMRKLSLKIQKFAEVVSLIKPRISYGLNGNVNGIGNFDVYGKYGSVGAYNGNLGYLNTGVVNSKLRWEKSHTFELGLDLGLFNNRVHMIMDYYNRTTSDLLTDVNLPEYTGFPSFKTNLGTISNRGFELEAKVNLLTKKELVMGCHR